MSLMRSGLSYVPEDSSLFALLLLELCQHCGPAPDRVITRCITRSVSVPGAIIRAMPDGLELLPARVSSATPGAGLAAELLGRVRAELPVVGELGEREQVLVSAWLTGLRSARTRRAYAGDAAAWLGWLAARETDVLAAGRVHVDLWAATQLDAGAAASSVRRRLSALSSFYRYGAAHDLTGRVPAAAWRGRWWIRTTRPRRLDRDQARALVAASRPAIRRCLR
jgi:Phage integrase, N-terminal SAM-like domain